MGGLIFIFRALYAKILIGAAAVFYPSGGCGGRYNKNE